MAGVARRLVRRGVTGAWGWGGRIFEPECPTGGVPTRELGVRGQPSAPLTRGVAAIFGATELESGVMRLPTSRPFDLFHADTLT